MTKGSYPKRGYTSAQEWHLYYCFTDKDFLRDIEKMRKSFEELPKETDQTRFFPHWLKLSLAPQWKDFLDKYSIDMAEAMLYLRGDWKKGFVFAKLEENMGWVRINEQNKTIEMTLTSFITRDRYLKLWKEVAKSKTTLASNSTRRRAPEYPELIFAVFKARRFGKKTYSQIFSDYKNKRLKGYTGPTLRFDTKDDLKAYFLRYNPDKK